MGISVRRRQTWTDEWVAHLRRPGPGKRDRVFVDPTLPGLRLVVKRTKKFFEVRETIAVRIADGVFERARKQRGEIVGVVDEARRRAVSLMTDIESATAVFEKFMPSCVEPVTLGQAWKRFIERDHIIKPRTIRCYKDRYERNLKQWAAVPLLSLVLTPGVAHEEHKKITRYSGPAAANDTMRLLRAIYYHAARFDANLRLDRHPCTAVEWNEDRTREGVAIPAEMMRHWKEQVEAIRVRNPVRACFHMLCLRLGARPGDLIRAKWSHVDWKRKVLYLPDTKSRPYEVPLSWQCLQEFRRLHEVPVPFKEMTGDFIFISPHVGFKSRGRMARWFEQKHKLSHFGNCGRHTHHTLGVELEIDELILDVLEGRSIMRARVAGRRYVDIGQLGRSVRRSQEKIQREIDRRFLLKSEGAHQEPPEKISADADIRTPCLAPPAYPYPGWRHVAKRRKHQKLQ